MNQTLKILLAEDNPGDMLIIDELIGETFPDASVVSASSFGDISRKSAAAAHFDAILLDLTLEDFQGATLINKVKEIYRDTPIIILTGYADLNFSVQSLTMGASDYLLKNELNGLVLQKSILYAIERQKFNNRITETERRYADLFQVIPVPIMTIDPVTLLINQANPAACLLYDYDERELNGLEAWKLLEEQYHSLFRERPSENHDAIRKLTETGKHLRRSGTEVEVICKATMIRINDRDFYALTVNDLTKVMELERSLTEAIIESQEAERFKISSELHDNVCQILAACSMKMAVLRNEVPAPLDDRFGDCLRHVRLASEEIRSLSHQLSPALYEDTTLRESIDRLLLTISPNTPTEILVETDPVFEGLILERGTHQHILRIIQEQVSNIIKYAQANQAVIRISYSDGTACLQVSDNGKGFDTDAKKYGIGLSNIRRRAELLSGKKSITSTPGKGSSLQITFRSRRIEIYKKS